MTPLSGLSAIADRYDAFILDLWGVVHDGSHLYPGVHEALSELRKAGKKIVMLSNAPRRAAKVEKVLNELGIEPGLYDRVYSSGEAGFEWLQECGNAEVQKCGNRYYYIGPAKDLDVLDGLPHVRVDDIKDADFLLNVGFGSEEQSTEDWMPLLRGAKGFLLPMVCLNPDLEVVKQTGEHFPCAGVIAHAYVQLGGEVTWFGKPFGSVYERCMEFLFPPPSGGRLGGGHSGEMSSNNAPTPALPLWGREKKRVLAIGDSLETDIPGAQNFGIDSALITGGILKKYPVPEIEMMCHRLKLAPTYHMPRLVW